MVDGGDVPAIALEEFQLDAATAHIVTRQWCEQHRALPLTRGRSFIVVVVADPTDADVVEHLAAVSGLAVHLVRATELELRTAIKEVFDRGAPN